MEMPTPCARCQEIFELNDLQPIPPILDQLFCSECLTKLREGDEA